MPRARLEDEVGTPDFLPCVSGRGYVLERSGGLWTIHFDGEKFGPYKTEREAMLFAIDAAQKLGQRGECTQVLVLEEDGSVRPAWAFGDSYPPQG